MKPADEVGSPVAVERPGAAERIAAVLKVGALAIGPAAAAGALLPIAPESQEFTRLFAMVLLFATVVASASRIGRWLALGASPFVDRAITTPMFAAGVAGTIEIAIRLSDRDAGWGFGAILIIPWLGVHGVYWAVASTFLARDGHDRSGPRRRTIRDLSLALALLGLYAAALRWLVAQGELVEESAASTIAGWTIGFFVVGLVPFGVDVGCRFAARRGRRRLLAAIVGSAVVASGALFVLGAFAAFGVGALVAGLAFPFALYVAIAAALAGMTDERTPFRKEPVRDDSRPSKGEPISLRAAASAIGGRLFDAFWGTVRFLGGW